MMMEESGSSVWAWEQDKAFESALALHHDDNEEDDSEGDRWERIAALVTGKSAEEVKRHYHILVHDVEAIESGQVILPNYNYAFSSSSLPDGKGGEDAVGEGGGKKSTGNSVVSRSEQERRKGIAWTEEEHRLFLLGLDKYGKGDWRSISRNFVITRTPTQVASHAQKYFIRLQSINKDRRRTSIHDITSIGNSDISSPQAPITGQANGVVTTPTSQASQMPIASGMYGGTHIGQPISSRPLISAVGTPVNMPAPGHVVYGVHAPGTRVSGPSSLNFPTTPYPLQQQQSSPDR